MKENTVSFLLNFGTISLFFSLSLLSIGGFLLAKILNFKEWYLFSFGFFIAALSHLIDCLSPYYFFTKESNGNDSDILKIIHINNMLFFTGFIMSSISLVWCAIKLKKRKFLG